MSHIVESWPLTKLNGGLSRLHSADEDAVSWLTNYGKWHAYEKKKTLKSLTILSGIPSLVRSSHNAGRLRESNVSWWSGQRKKLKLTYLLITGLSVYKSHLYGITIGNNVTTKLNKKSKQLNLTKLNTTGSPVFYAVCMGASQHKSTNVNFQSK